MQNQNANTFEITYHLSPENHSPESLHALLKDGKLVEVTAINNLTCPDRYSATDLIEEAELGVGFQEINLTDASSPTIEMKAQYGSVMPLSVLARLRSTENDAPYQPSYKVVQLGGARFTSERGIPLGTQLKYADILWCYLNINVDRVDCVFVCDEEQYLFDFQAGDRKTLIKVFRDINVEEMTRFSLLTHQPHIPEVIFLIDADRAAGGDFETADGPLQGRRCGYACQAGARLGAYLVTGDKVCALDENTERYYKMDLKRW
jgi:hypothetical protein